MKAAQLDRSDHRARCKALGTVRRWAPVFGCDVPPRGLERYGLVVIDGIGGRDGDARPSAEEVAALGARSLVLSYVSVGTVESWRPYADRVPDAWTLGAVPNWDGERYVDAREVAWGALLASEVRQLAAAGFDGLYLDNLDVAEEFPAVADAVVSLVAMLRVAVPELLLVAQNGLAVADRLAIDAIAHEDVFWRWDDGYRRSRPDETEEILTGLRRCSDRGLPVFTLDYAAPGTAAAVQSMWRSLAEGFRPAVSVLGLDRLPHATSASDDGT